SGAGDAGEALDVAVPGSNVRVPNRPISAHALFHIRREVDIAESEAAASPHERAPADVIAPIPVEALRLGVGRLLLVDPPVGVLLVELARALEDGMAPNQILRATTAVRVLPRRFLRIRVI